MLGYIKNKNYWKRKKKNNFLENFFFKYSKNYKILREEKKESFPKKKGNGDDLLPHRKGEGTGKVEE